MKIQKKSFVSKAGCFLCAFVVLALAGIAVQSQATIYTLTEGDSSVNVNDASGSGSAYNWTIGGVNQLANQWLYYRIGATGPESRIDSLSAPVSVLDPNGKELTTTYSNSTIGLSVVVYFKLTDSANPGQSQFDLNVTVNNLLGVSQAVNLFQYSDYDLGGNSSDQSAQFSLIAGKYRSLVQTDGASVLTETVNPIPSTSTTITVQAVSDGSILASLTDGSATTLNNDASEGVGDITYAFEWSRTLAAGGTFQISKLQGIVPEPSALALISLGGFIMSLMKRRREISI